MRRLFALMMALLMLILCACGQESAPAQTEPEATIVQTEPVIEETQTDKTVKVTPKGEYIIEFTMDDGTNVTLHRKGSENGPIIYELYNYPDGSSSAVSYTVDGDVLKDVLTDADGTIHEYSYDANGDWREYTTYPDGTIQEVVYDGQSGIVLSDKTTTTDGQVMEENYDVAENDDGTYWQTAEWNDGTIVKTHYSKTGIVLEEVRDNEMTGAHAEVEYVDGQRSKEIQTNEKTGDHTEITFYKGSKEKTRDSYYAEKGMHSYLEYYESGIVKYSLLEYDDGYKREEKINEAGYTTYYYDSGINMEFFADDNGELVKCVDKGTVYEGNAIPSQARETFNRVRDVPATDVSTTKGEGGSSTTTTTYADGTVSTSGTTADGCAFSRSVSPDGTESYHEYYPSGKTKLFTHKTADTFQEVHYDEDGYYTYFHMVSPGYELEITTDETGKVDKVLLNGVEQTDVESIVKDMFFRSW